MKILHVLSQFEVTGAEVYAATLIHHQAQEGHEVVVVSDRFHKTLPQNARVIEYPIGKRNWFQRMRTFFFLRGLFRREKFDLIHAHSRAASWSCFYARLGSFVFGDVTSAKLPLISTIHGRQHLHLSSKAFSVYGDFIIAVCENIKTHLIHDLRISERKIRVLPNPIPVALGVTPATSASRIRAIIAGRTTGPKGERAVQLYSQVFPELLKEFPTLDLVVAGGAKENLPHSAQAEWKKLESQFGARVKFVGYTQSLQEELAQASFVIASGRIAVEAIYLGKPVYAMGESLIEGWVAPENYSRAKASNFGDIHAVGLADHFESGRIVRELRAAIIQGNWNIDPEVKTLALQDFDATRVARDIQRTLEGVRARKVHPKWIPVLMYHKIPDALIPSKHRIFVPVKKFIQQMAFLHDRGFDSITFKDYFEFTQAKRKLPKKPIILTFDDAYLDNFTNAYPVLKSFQYRAVIFSLGDTSQTKNFWDHEPGAPEAPLMNVHQRKMLIDQHFEFGAHSLTHRDLNTLSATEAEKEIVESKLRLESELGTKIISFAYPYGYSSASIRAQTRDAGYEYAVATDTGGLHLEDDRFQIFRVSIFPEDGPLQIWKKTSAWYRGLYRVKRGK